MADIFISYSREDEVRIRPLVAALEQEGFSVWWDRSLAPGARFAEVIDHEIQQAACVLVAWSKDSVASQWVKNEALEGMDREVLIPILLDAVRLPVAFKQHQIADFTDWPQRVDPDQYQRLIDVIHLLSRGEKMQRADSNVPGVLQATAETIFRRRGNYLLPLMMAVVLGLVVMLVMFERRSAPENQKLVRLTINRFIGHGDKQSEFYANSITREVRLRFESVKGIELVRVNSIWDFNLLDVPEALTSKAADFVVNGQVETKDDQIHVTMNVAAAATGKVLWNGDLKDDVSNMIDLQQNVVHAVLGEVKMASSSQISLPSIQPVTTDEEAYRDYLIGQDLLRRGEEHNVRQAISRFDDAIERDPHFVQAEAATCHAYLELFRATKAVDDFNTGKTYCEKVLKVNKDSAQTHLALAELYRASGSLESAKLEYLNTLELESSNPDAIIGLADVLVKEGDMQGGEEMYLRCVKENPTYWKAHNALGSYYFRQGMLNKAIESYTRVTQLTSSNAVGFSNLGAARLYTGDFRGATAALKRANELDTNSASFSNLGTALYHEGKFSDALEQYKAALAIDPNDYRLWGNVADNLRLLPGRSADARQAYNKAIELANAVIQVNPKDAYTLSRLAIYYAATGKRTLSIDMSRRADKLAGLDLNVLYDLAIASSLLGNTSDANKYVSKAIQSGYPEVLLKSDPQLNIQKVSTNEKNS